MSGASLKNNVKYLFDKTTKNEFPVRELVRIKRIVKSLIEFYEYNVFSLVLKHFDSFKNDEFCCKSRIPKHAQRIFRVHPNERQPQE